MGKARRKCRMGTSGPGAVLAPGLGLWQRLEQRAFRRPVTTRSPRGAPDQQDGRKMPGHLVEHRDLNGFELRCHGQAMFAGITAWRRPDPV